MYAVHIIAFKQALCDDTLITMSRAGAFTY